MTKRLIDYAEKHASADAKRRGLRAAYADTGQTHARCPV